MLTASTSSGVSLCTSKPLITAFNAIYAFYKSRAVTSMNISLVLRSIFEYSELIIGGKLSTYPRPSRITGQTSDFSINGRYSDNF